MTIGEHVYLIQPDSRMRAAWFRTLAVHPDRVVRGFSTAAEFMVQKDELAGGCVLIDWGGIGPADARDLLAALAGRTDMLRFIVADHLSRAEVRALLRTGVCDLFPRPPDPEDLRLGIDAGLADIRALWHSRQERAAAMRRIGRLTTRERAILASLAEGLSNKAVARRFDLSPRTVEVHRANILRRAEAANLAELLRLQILSEQYILTQPVPESHVTMRIGSGQVYP